MRVFVVGGKGGNEDKRTRNRLIWKKEKSIEMEAQERRRCWLVLQENRRLPLPSHPAHYSISTQRVRRHPSQESTQTWHHTRAHMPVPGTSHPRQTYSPPLLCEKHRGRHSTPTPCPPPPQVWIKKTKKGERHKKGICPPTHTVYT
jgi:hypothetical protein